MPMAHQPLYWEKVLYNLRGGFLVRPLAIALVLGLTGATLSNVEEAFPQIGSLAPSLIFPSHSDPQVAQTILVCIAGSVMTVVSIVFAILLMSLTLASMQFSPRIILNFTVDRVTQWTLGIFLGTFTYCISALPAARTKPSPFSPVTTVSGAMVLALVCVAWLLFFIHHISREISVNHIVDRIATETDAMVDEMMPKPLTTACPRPESDDFPQSDGAPVLSRKSGYVRHLDVHRLVRTAKQHRVCVEVVRRVGHFVPEGIALARVAKPEKLNPRLVAEILDSFDIGPTRTLQQDVEFGILQIVDIALKAISPAVNDPSTAISCVDHLSRILIRCASREPQESRFFDPPGVLRLFMPVLGLERLVHSGFDQIRVYAKGDAAVNLRLLRALGDIAHTVEDPRIRQSLANLGERIVAGSEDRLDEEELKEMRLRLYGLQQLALPAE